ncbi:RNA polymerase sigma factor [Spirosoma sordidisoli]|uniref:Sigma-70 family RNA polymerase sigma factor n=1 Tax=Spirosoma sordidisoli TaxID=2502893 RepID=A0A4Q2UT99_9BACT|nr:sigma-70 family RNA polymerase sigma factor [Spirosoma sordidisoli]RYC70049.1 sigma-70 family RNA polymerase sigma factor [Spirosoma sordidisoli]
MDFFLRKDWRDPYRRLADSDLLERIRAGCGQAPDYLMETYLPPLLSFARKEMYGKPQALGEPGDYAHDALLLLWTRAKTEGAAVLKHDATTILGWLKQTVRYRLNNAERKEQKHWRDAIQTSPDDEPTESILTQIADPSACLTDKPEKEVFDIVEEVLDIYPKKEPPLDTLVRKRWMEWLSWKETAAVMAHLYPTHAPAFEPIYVERSYWGRNHRVPFNNLLRNVLKRYGYDS